MPDNEKPRRLGNGGASDDDLVGTEIRDNGTDNKDAARSLQARRILTLDQLADRFARAADELVDIERRQDELYVEWTVLQADIEILNRKLEAFARAVPGCLGDPAAARNKR